MSATAQLSPAAARKEEKRHRILRAAVEVFADKGYFGARMADVARRADVADGTLYLYFAGKEDLLVSIFDEQLSGFVRELRHQLADVDDPVEKLRTLVRRHLEALTSDRPMAHVMQIETRHSRRFMSLFTRGRLGDYLKLVREVISEGQERGRLRQDLPPKLATIVVFGAIDALITSWLLADEPWELDEAPEKILDMLLDGLAAG